MLKDLSIEEVVSRVRVKDNVYGIKYIGNDVYQLNSSSYTGPKGATKYVNELRKQVNELNNHK